MRSSLEVALNPRLLRRFQEWFQEDLSRVKVCLFPPHDPVPASQTPLAFAVPDTIFLSDSVAASGERQITPVLIHEFAHIVQKKRGQAPRANGKQRGATATSLEAEAHHATLAFVTGGECPDLSADPAPEARLWGPAGHFYTAYWVARFAGVPDDLAEKLAFYTQMPDQVSDFDAKQAGMAWGVSAFLPGGKIRDRVVGGEDRFDHSIYRVQAGLHCLNGRNSDAESKRRLALLRKLPKDAFLTFSFGLGVHALGDSYAHRKGDGSMFMAPVGHGFAGKNLYERLIKVGTEIDNINEHPELYSRYCDNLFEAMAERFNPSLSPGDRSDLRPALGHKIADATRQPEENSQIATMLAFYPDRKGSYTPESDPVFWEDFQKLHPSETAPWMLDKAQALMEAWTT